MDPRKIPYFTDSDGEKYEVEVIVTDFNGLAIGKVNIKGKSQYVIRWNGGIDDDSNVGFPNSHGHGIWMVLPEGIKLSIEV